ncbi:glycosyl transferase family 28 [Burkholderia stagnalis]|uniref:glycosyltransferase n=1 Tax=Burkholderia stagnalis TaxID=1503054 RepID=UPI00075ADC4D|nr:glycosyltransferase [Burkholderia stagnalis]KVD84303.1 glycosyl transferase family 28 [Burkholderia stagnalis]KWK47946.1 glycosyl transferase family 28 [Burkholderia stagnalis]KWK66732.1 glycosyl transferase family 28 [Burkholderia stagnalis]KWN73455.1 glycosyl transferase family 28 [Burkholderia stagnalis]
MILLTVGTQKPFDRLIRLADAWAEHHPNVNIYAQTCDGAAYIPRNMKHRAFLSKEEIDALSATATLIVSHAGMGSILTARRLRKPIVVVPREHRLNEHRNDHQIDTARSLDGLPGMHVCWRDGDFSTVVEAALGESGSAYPEPGGERSLDLVRKLANWVDSQ